MSTVTTKAVRPKHQSKIKLTTFSRNVIERSKTYDVKYVPGFGYGTCLYGKDPYGTPCHSFNISTTWFFSGRPPTFSSPYAIKWMVTSSITNWEPDINPHSQSVIESLEYILDYIRYQPQKSLLIFNRFLTDVQKPEYHPSIIQAFHSTSTLERGTFISKEISIHLHKVLVQPHPTTSIQRYLGSPVVQGVSNLTRTTILGRVMEHTLQRIVELERAHSVKHLINTSINLFSTPTRPSVFLNAFLTFAHTHPSQRVIPYQSILNGQHYYNFHSTASRIQDGRLDYQPIEAPYSVFSINGSIAVLKLVAVAIYVRSRGYGIEPYGKDLYGSFRMILELTIP